MPVFVVDGIIRTLRPARGKLAASDATIRRTVTATYENLLRRRLQFRSQHHFNPRRLRHAPRRLLLPDCRIIFRRLMRQPRYHRHLLTNCQEDIRIALPPLVRMILMGLQNVPHPNHRLPPMLPNNRARQVNHLGGRKLTTPISQPQCRSRIQYRPGRRRLLFQICVVHHPVPQS